MRGEPARLIAEDLRHGRAGLAFAIREGAERVAIATPLIGDYNVANLLCVVGVLRALGVSLAHAAGACAALGPVPGRMERVQGGRVSADAIPEVVVDYAHTPDALEKALAALAPLAKERGGALWCVFGCGGNRDAAKRPLMGAIACRLAARVVITSDNPRLESPDLILAQILAGAIGHDEVDVIENRAEAIRHAVGSAAPSDVVLIAGKGHEDYQDIGGAKFPFSDARHAADALAARVAPDTSAGAVDRSMPTMLTLGDAARMLPGARQVGAATTAIARVHSDTRSVAPGDLFVALRGEHFDAHDYLAEARAGGAVAALSERELGASGLAGLIVADTRAALGELAAAWRRRFAIPLVAVTGSNGKTTVTQMIAAILRAWLGPRGVRDRGQLQQRRRRAADPAALARRPPRRRRRARHEPLRRDRALGRDRRADDRVGQQRAARASGVHGQRRGGRARERQRDRGARCRRRGGFSGRRRARRDLACAVRRASRRHLRARRAGRRLGPRRVARRPLVGGDARHRPVRRALRCEWPGGTTFAMRSPRAPPRWRPAHRSTP